MSTKTTFKRVALVAVAALGFGTVSAISPANAIGVSFTTNASSYTSVGASSPQITVAITLTADTGVALAAGESLTVTTVGVPVGTSGTAKTLTANAASGTGRTTGHFNTVANDLSFLEVEQAAATGIDPVWGSLSADTNSAMAAVASETSTDGQFGARNTRHYGMSSAQGASVADTNTALWGKTSTYYLQITPRTGATVIDQGVYTVQIDLTDAAGNTIQRSTIKVDFVTAAADSGAKLTAASTGSWFIGNTPSIANQTTTKSITAAITNRDGGVIRLASGSSPVLSAQVADASTVPVIQGLTADDLGYNGGNEVDGIANDGNYGIYGAQFTAVKGPLTLTVRYGLAVATASVTINLAASSNALATASIVGAGQIDSTDAATLPLTTKAVTVKVKVTESPTTTALTGYSMYYTLAYGASCVAGDMAPAKASSPVKVVTDASGVAELAITNAFPLDGCTATVTWTGAVTNDAAQVITWSKTKAAAALSNPGGNYKAVLLSAQSVTWTIVDTFGAIMPGATVTISHTGANAPTAAPAARSADAKGQVTYTWTDAKATTTTTDVVSVATVNAVAPTTSTGAVTVSYVATLPAVASIKAQYAATTALVASTGSPITVPATAIGTSVGGRLISATDQLDLTKAVTGASADNFVALKFTAEDSAAAAVTGVPMTVTVTNGHILGADNVPTTSRILYANESFYAVGTMTGVATYTATVGSVTKSATILWANAAADARVLTVTESAGTITATVKDFMGNAVSAVTVAASLTGTGRLGNGATYSTFVTASNGSVSFDVNGSASVAVSISAATYAKSTWLAGYGDATGTLVTTGAPAGVRSVTVATEGNTVVASAAQAAADAAAEATDAANAATDAANAAAEAADAATAAAQDSADAVAALSTQVSEMISALKKQITALTNLVIKIQKKVRA
jgi:trimeric autotransporter adhesin